MKTEIESNHFSSGHTRFSYSIVYNGDFKSVFLNIKYHATNGAIYYQIAAVKDKTLMPLLLEKTERVNLVNLYDYYMTYTLRK